MKKSPQAGPKKTAPKNRASALSAARRAAFDLLLAVESGQNHSDDLLRGRAVNALSAADRNLATALVLGVLRRQIVLDARLRDLLKHPGAKLDPAVRIALRLGAFQLLHMDRIPARAAIDESVELAKQAGQRFASAMVNAVLRRLATEPRAEGREAEEAIAAHPAWMVERWREFFGQETAAAICLHGQSQPRLTVRLAGIEEEAELTAAGIALEPGLLLSAARTVLSGDVSATAAFAEGRVRLQDEGSQLVAELAGFAPEADSNTKRKILDACAAPGGKTLILAERNPAAQIVACEFSPVRHEQLRRRLALLGERVECRLADASALGEEGLFDLALVDAPCSGTGTLGRNPEIRHRLRLEDLARQAERQTAILAAALRAVRPGGRVLYSTCSLEPEENEQVVAAVLAATAGAAIAPLGARIDDLQRAGILLEGGAERLRSALTAEGFLRLLPGVLPTDGFFIALLEKGERAS
jgi:16S rRNA (cytosine967-C5)-methyltransferase